MNVLNDTNLSRRMFLLLFYLDDINAPTPSPLKGEGKPVCRAIGTGRGEGVIVYACPEPRKCHSELSSESLLGRFVSGVRSSFD
jgi:hypothetical protein